MRRIVLILCVCVMSMAAWADFAATPHLAGDFNAWNEAANPMVETAPGSGIWTATISGQAPNVRQEFKITDGTWDSAYPGDNSWLFTDGSGEVTVTFTPNPAVDGWDPTANRLGTSTATDWTIAGDFQGWDNANPATAMTSLGGGIYEYSQAILAGTYDWKAVRTSSWDSISWDSRTANTQNMTLVLAADADVNFYVDEFTGTVGIGEDINLSFLGRAYHPDPKNGAVVGTGLAALSWTNPDPNNPADTATSDVYFLDAGLTQLTQDPNMGPTITDPGVVQIADDITAETLDLNDALVTVLPLQDDHYYYWAVHATDPNTPGSGVTTQGNTWYFFTGDAAPVPGQPVDQYMWLSQDDFAVGGIGDTNPNVRYFEVTATYTDDGRSPVTDANFVNLSWGWDPDGVNGEVQRGITEVSDTHTPGVGGGTVTAIYKTEYNATDPNYTTDLTGYFDIQLEVTDGTGTATGASGHHEIHVTCGGAAYWDPDDTFDGTYDYNGDCIVNLIDFSEFAKAWFYQGVKYE